MDIMICKQIEFFSFTFQFSIQYNTIQYNLPFSCSTSVLLLIDFDDVHVCKIFFSPSPGVLSVNDLCR
ncbi:unnamed protein product [Amoebophrya sp. A25]|nr:unnamed protein product [Amoebophrya sp. A25]|eukprot:GSA25T00000297001.1